MSEVHVPNMLDTSGTRVAREAGNRCITISDRL